MSFAPETRGRSASQGSTGLLYDIPNGGWSAPNLAAAGRNRPHTRQPSDLSKHRHPQALTPAAKHSHSPSPSVSSMRSSHTSATKSVSSSSSLLSSSTGESISRGRTSSDAPTHSASSTTSGVRRSQSISRTSSQREHSVPPGSKSTHARTSSSSSTRASVLLRSSSERPVPTLESLSVVLGSVRTSSLARTASDRAVPRTTAKASSASSARKPTPLPLDKPEASPAPASATAPTPPPKSLVDISSIPIPPIPKTPAKPHLNSFTSYTPMPSLPSTPAPTRKKTHSRTNSNESFTSAGDSLASWAHAHSRANSSTSMSSFGSLPARKESLTPASAAADPGVEYGCKACGLKVAPAGAILSDSFQGFDGRASLFNNVEVVVSNLKLTKPTVQLMCSGAYTIQEVNCGKCQAYFGWKLVKAHEWVEKWKEGEFLLEMAALKLQSEKESTPSLAALAEEELRKADRKLLKKQSGPDLRAVASLQSLRSKFAGSTPDVSGSATLTVPRRTRLSSNASTPDLRAHAYAADAEATNETMSLSGFDLGPSAAASKLERTSSGRARAATGPDVWQMNKPLPSLDFLSVDPRASTSSGSKLAKAGALDFLKRDPSAPEKATGKARKSFQAKAKPLRLFGLDGASSTQDGAPKTGGFAGISWPKSAGFGSVSFGRGGHGADKDKDREPPKSAGLGRFRKGPGAASRNGH